MRLFCDHSSVVNPIRKRNIRNSEDPAVLVHTGASDTYSPADTRSGMPSDSIPAPSGTTSAFCASTFTFTGITVSSVPMEAHAKTPARRRITLASNTQIPGFVTRR